MSKTIATLLAYGKEALKTDKNSPLEAQILLAHVLTCERVTLIAWPEKKVNEEKVKQYEKLIARRQTGEPIAYLIGYKEFWSLHFQVTKDTLIPRYETELLVQTVLDNAAVDAWILDLGTGCGAIGCALASSLPHAKIIAVDISFEAINIAKQNAQNLHIPNIEFFQSNWFENITHTTFDIIVSNPPYIREYDLHLTMGALPFEPRIALTPGPSGVEAFKLIVTQSKKYLKNRGLIAFEHGYDQANVVQTILEQAGFENVQTFHDLAGLERVTIGHKKA